MEIGLVDTGYKDNGGGEPHLGLAYIAAALHQTGHRISVLDIAHSTGKEQGAFFRKPFGLIGITATSFAFVTALGVAKAIKEQNSFQKIVLGGPHVAVAREEVLSNPEFDYAIYGEGENTIVTLVKALMSDDFHSSEMLCQIQGLIFRDGNNVMINPPAARINILDDLPFPFYEPFPMSRYEIHPILTSRGCPYNCVYCASSAIWGSNWIPRTPENLVCEIEQVIAQWGKKPFHIVDDSFNLQENRIKEFCQLLLDKNLNITWNASGFRADKADPEMLRLMKASGCIGVCIGIESANPIVLEKIGKKETIKQIEEGIFRIKESGLFCLGMFMIGNPGDTLQTVQESLEFAKIQPLDVIRFYLALPFPNTRLWGFVKEHGRFLRKDYVNFHDFSEEPLFETEEFPFADRVHAYKLAKDMMFPPQPQPELYSHGIHAFPFWLHVLIEKYREKGMLFVLWRIVKRCGGWLWWSISRLLRNEQREPMCQDISQTGALQPESHDKQDERKIRTRFAPQ